MVQFNSVEVNIAKKEILWNGVTIPESAASDIGRAFERMCTAELLLNEYEGLDEEVAFDYADSIRDQMDDYGLTESEAIDEISAEIEMELADDDEEDFDDDEEDEE